MAESPIDKTLTEEDIARLSKAWSQEDKPLESRIAIARRLFEHLFFLSPPQVEDSNDRDVAFDNLLDEHLALGGYTDLDYSLPYNKWEFLNHLTAKHHLLVHGSSKAFSVLRPNPQTDWSGSRIEAVFATSDAIWSTFFAILNWDAMSGSIRNGGFVVESPHGRHERYYFFSVNAKSLGDVFQPGFIHIVSREGFTTDSSPVRFDEWHRLSEIEVIARLAVEPEDFPFLNRVAEHWNEDESINTTWLNYKARLGLN